jgi:hypothetical protein
METPDLLRLDNDRRNEIGRLADAINQLAIIVESQCSMEGKYSNSPPWMLIPAIHKIRENIAELIPE